MNPLDDIITAIATPIGEGGLAIVRVSGKGSIHLLDARFIGKHPLTSASTHTAHVGYFADSVNQQIDEVVVTVFHAPHSYTGEESVEVSCHGGMFITSKILESILSAGARQAEPGEFTKRAFLNGRMDLSQAEATADLIRSRTEQSHRVAFDQIRGRLSGKIGFLREELVKLCGLMELELDFAEEGLEFTDKLAIASAMRAVSDTLEGLIDSYREGKIYREGVKTVIAGKPNVGKSSILNALLNENRAIVTDIPGTTRDVIEENLNINGILFSLSDTAGLRESLDSVEQEGISRARQLLSGSDLVLFVLNSAECAIEGDLKVLDELCREQAHRTILAMNKVDLCEGKSPKLPPEYSEFVRVDISAKTGYGLATLKKEMVAAAIGRNGPSSDQSIIITNLRHRDSLVRAQKNIQAALHDLESGMSNEFITISLRMVLDDLGEITGIVTTDEILNTIFSKFCIGK